MAGLTAGGDPWRITTDERAKHDSQFFQLKPENGFITGVQARNFFIQSGLPTPVLGQIWSLADMNADGKMDRKEFSIAMHLIQKKLQGFDLPRTLPPSLKADPMSGTGSGVPVAGQPMTMGVGGMVRPFGPSPVAPMMSSGVSATPVFNGYYGSSTSSFPGTHSGSMVTPMASISAVSAPTNVPAAPYSSTSSDEWGVPQSSRLKYTQLFNMHDRHKRGHLNGMEARGVLTQSSLSQMILAQIWNLADINKNGNLTCEEFILAMHLVDLAKSGQSMPAALPPKLLPPSFRLVKPGQAIGLPPGGLPSAPVPMPMNANVAAPTTTVNGSKELDAAALAQITFEDRRKENFDKGQAELERRRQLLLEQQRKLEEERLAKERAEAEKREQKRLEAERQRQAELERQMERQRQIEQQREEERRKALEQREAARRELERQRQMEWERQRRDHLMVEKQRTEGLVDNLNGDVAKHKLELDAMDSKKIDLQAQIQKAQQSVEDITHQIGQMKQSRDFKLSNLEKVNKEVQEWRNKVLVAQQERTRLEMTRSNQESASVGDYDSVHSTFKHKQSHIEKVRAELQALEQQLAEKQAAGDAENKKQLEMKQKKINAAESLSQSVKDLKNTSAKVEQAATQQDSRNKSPFVTSSVPTSSKPPASVQPTTHAWASAFDTNTEDLFSQSSSIQWGSSTSSKPATDVWAGTSSSQPSTDAWANTSSSQPATDAWAAFPSTTDSESRPGFSKYRGLFPFEARNPDELSFGADDTIWVKLDQSDAEPGWMIGEAHGREGVFPEAYAEKVEDGAPATAAQQDAWANFSTAEAEQSTAPGSFESDFSKSKNAFTHSSNSLTASVDSSFTAVMGAPSPTPGSGQKAPEGLHAQAVYTWRAKKDNHLTFDKGDVILVTEQQDMWWAGELNGKTGWFPKSYVKIIGTEAPREEPSLYQNIEATATSGASDAVDKACAMFTYNSDVADDLTFTQGEIIDVISKKDADWWEGRIGERSGLFPASYVKPVSEVEAEAAALNDTAAEASQPPEQHAVTVEATAMNGGPAPPAAEVTSADVSNASADAPPTEAEPTSALAGQKVKVEIVRAHAPYEATGPEQLSLQPGQLIKVRKKSPSGWWEGELQARGQKRKVGWFPANYVTVMSGSAQSTPEPSANQLAASPLQDSDSRSTTPVGLPAPSVAPSLEQVVALYNYKAQHDDELTFTKSSVINVLVKDDPDWWKGELNGVVGMFPSNYVQPLESLPTKSASSGSLDTLDEGKKRQNLIRELIQTEEAYVADLNVILNSFYKPIKDSQLLAAHELEQVFVNLRDIRRCHIKMLNGMKVRKRNSEKGQVDMIGDILCENFPQFSFYLRFCSCQLNAANLLCNKEKENEQFKELQKKLGMDPNTKGMTLSSYLMKPMQRITRYPLLLEKLVKYTPADHPDYYYLQQSLSEVQNFCRQVEQAVREKDNSDKLEWIQTHVICDGLPEKLTFNSLTNSLGPRHLLYSGSLTKVKSKKELIGFLFNDFLLLTVPQQSVGPVASVFSFDVKTDTQFKPYREIMFLNELDVEKGEDSISFLLKYTDGTVLAVKAINSNERDAWCKKTEEASTHYKETERNKKEKLKQESNTVGVVVGRLLVTIIEGVNLQHSDENGKSDPYCEVSMGPQENKTEVIPKTLNPKWNASMQFNLRNLHEDVLCITVYDRDWFTPNDFLGRTEVMIREIQQEMKDRRGPIIKRLKLYEVPTGEVIVKLDIQIFS